MNTSKKYSKGDKAFIAPNVRPTYIQGVEVEVLGFRRGRYDVKVADDPKARRYAGVTTRCEESWLVGKPGQKSSSKKPAKKEPVKKFKAGDTVKVKEGVRPSYLPGTVVKIVADRRGKYDVQMPTDVSLSRFSGVTARFSYTSVEATDEQFEQTDGTVKVWATLVPEKGLFTKKSPGDIYELFKTKAQADREADDLIHPLEVKQVEVPAMMPVIVWGPEDQFIEGWFLTVEARDQALANYGKSGGRPAEWPVSRVLAHEKQMRDEHKAEMRAEGMMS